MPLPYQAANSWQQIPCACHTGGMDWKLFSSTFAAVFLAELGDKTQLATLSLAAGSRSRWMVFAGSALALVATSAIAVLAGEALTRAVPPIWIKRAAGALFVVMGVLFLVRP
jgi:putative Ca2+/H+ antiporter (TMEM165/GDT1 family)